MAQRPFVGRRVELERLLAVLDGVMAGRGGTVLLAGEAGIGKSALARALAARAEEAGARVLAGACIEGEWAPPFSPWSEALDEVDPIGPGFEAPLGAGEARHRLFDAVSRRLLALARDRPLVVVLDDLHWADGDSLALFAHLARFAARGRLLLVGAFRDPDPALMPGHPLGDLVALLARRDDCLRVPVRAFSLDEAESLLAAEAGASLPQALLRALHEESAGNAFYLLELLRHLVEERKVVARGGAITFDASVGELGIPAGVRAVLARRVARLSEGARVLLSHAAVLPAGFRPSVLARTTGLDEERLIDAIEEARRAGLLVTGDDGRHRFSHALARRALDHALSPDRRARIARAVAEAIEAVEDVDAAPAEIASLYHLSRALPGAERGVPHALAAAEAARVAGALERVISLLHVARDLLPNGVERARVLGRIAVAEAEALRFDQACESARSARAVLAAAGATNEERADLMARVARVLRVGGAPPSLVEPLVAQGLALVGDSRDLTWARLRLLCDRLVPVVAGPVYVARLDAPDPEAITLLRERGDEEDVAATIDPYDARARDETERLLARARRFRSRAAGVRAASALARDYFFRHHDLRAALAASEELYAEAAQLGQLPAQAVALTLRSCAESALGHLRRARETIDELHGVAERIGSHHRMHAVGPAAARCMLGYYAGCDWRRELELLQRIATDPATLATPLGLVSGGLTVLGLGQLGDRAEALRLLPSLARAHAEGPRTIIDWGPSTSSAAAAVWALHLDELAPIYRRLASDPEAASAGSGPFDCRELIRARMAVLEGDADEARACFALARERLDLLGLAPARALADLDEAEAIERLATGEQPRARALLDDALRAFERMEMTPWIERARAAIAGLDGAPTSPAGLSVREVEVLRLLADGRANKEIAAALFISVATVERHIANIYDKIGVRGRASATAWALRHLPPATR